MGSQISKAGVAGDGQKCLQAARTGNVEHVVSKVNTNPSMLWIASFGSGNTMWHLAAKYGHHHIIHALAHAVKSVGSLTEKQKRSLETYLALSSQEHPAARRCPNTAEDLLRFFLELRNSKGQTALMLACAHGHSQCVGGLIQHGSNVWSVDRQYQNTCLHYAAQNGHAHCISTLFDTPFPPPPTTSHGTPSSTGRFIDYRNRCGFSALHYAVWSGCCDAVRAVLLYGPDMRACSIVAGGDWVVVKEGCTALHMAVMKGDVDIVRELVKAIVEDTRVRAHDDIDPRTLCNCYGVLPYDMALMHGRWRMAAMLVPGRTIHDLFDVLMDGSLHGRRAQATLGPPKLATIAAAALQRKLLNSIQFAHYELASPENEAATASASRAAHLKDPKTAQRIGLPIPGGKGKGGMTPKHKQGGSWGELEGLDDEEADMAMKGEALALGRNVKRVMPGLATSPTGSSSSSAGPSGFMAASSSFLSTSPSTVASSNWWYDKTHHGGMEHRRGSGEGSGAGPRRATLSGREAREYMTGLAGAFDDELLGDELDDEGCGICFSQKEQVVAEGCGHKLCVTCAREICNKHKYDPATCPFCRGLIRGFHTDALALSAAKHEARHRRDLPQLHGPPAQKPRPTSLQRTLTP